MRIQLTTDRAGVTFYQREGEIVDLPSDEALALVRSGQAIPVIDSATIETAALSPRESVEIRNGPKHRKGKNQ